MDYTKKRKIVEGTKSKIMNMYLFRIIKQNININIVIKWCFLIFQHLDEETLLGDQYLNLLKEK